jgi:ASC-1-like (ASCH) protein
MNKHELNLKTTPFEAIKSGKKTIESRLFDEKRKLINLDDEIEFTNRETGEKLIVIVVGLHRFRNFSEMFNSMNPGKFGHESTGWLLNQISEFYTDEEQKLLGVIGIEFKLT